MRNLVFKQFIWAIFLTLFILALYLPAQAADISIGTGEVFTVNTGEVYTHYGNITITADGRLEVMGALNLEGHLIIYNNGVAEFDGGELHVQGNDTYIALFHTTQLRFINNALLHYVQTYYNQHGLYAGGDAQIEFQYSRVDCDGSAEVIKLYERASYTGVGTQSPDWKTWYMHQQASLDLDGVNIAGDIVFYDQVSMHFKNTVGVMPWLIFESGAVVDYSFPAAGNTVPVSAALSNTTPGISGIDWTLTMENCYAVAWGINPYPGSNVTIRDSSLKMILYRFQNTGVSYLDGIMRNNSYYPDLILPFSDRTLRLVNTSVLWWKIDVDTGHELHAENIVCSEMVVKKDSKSYVKHSTCEGQTIHLGAMDDAYVEFENGEVWTYVTTWQNAVMILRNSLVDYTKGEYTYQTRNIAHQNTRLYCLNTTFGYKDSPLESEPEAINSALTTYLFLNTPASVSAGETLEISGSAWIKSGPDLAAGLDHYALSVAPAGTSSWTELGTYTAEVRDSLLGQWDTTGWNPGEYSLRLMVWVSGLGAESYPPENYPAEKTIQLLATATPTPTTIHTPTTTGTATPAAGIAQIDFNGKFALAYPNPAQDQVRFALNLEGPADVRIEIYNMTGERVGEIRENAASGHIIIWECADIAAGVYLARLTVDKKTKALIKIALIR